MSLLERAYKKPTYHSIERAKVLLSRAFTVRAEFFPKKNKKQSIKFVLFVWKKIRMGAG